MSRKMLIAFAALAFLFSASAVAETVVPGGDVFGTWDEFGSPYLIKEEITVPAGQTLTIEPGVVVDVRGHFKMIVHGCLEAVGTERQRILFTAANSTEGWHGIRFIDAPEAGCLEWCIIEHGRAKGTDINDPEGWGGGIFCSGSSPAITDCIIRNCSAIGSGGGIFCHQSKSEITRCNFTGNYASILGGGVAVYLSDVAIRQSGITNNSSDMWGGAIYTQDSDTEIEDCAILRNQADQLGGGINANNWPKYQEKLLTVRGCTITGNSSGMWGGGISGDTLTMVIEDNVISGNRAPGRYGGGIYVNNSAGTIENNIISGNTALAGGGISMATNCSVDLINNRITGNSATEDGGGIRCTIGSSILLRNMTIADNVAARGGGIFARNRCTVRSINTILWGNKSHTGEAVWIGGSIGTPSTLSISHCDVQPGDSSLYVALGSALEWGDGMVAKDPMFIDPANGDYNLCQDPCQPGVKNPCVNTGHPLSPVIPGSTRSDCCCDVGLVDMGYHSPVPNSVATNIWIEPDSGVLPFTTRVSATMRNALGVQRTMVGQIAVTLANGMSYHNLRPGVVDLGPHESHVLNWNQDLPAQERYLGINTFELFAVDVTPAPFNQSPYPMSGDTDKDTATVTGTSQ